MQFASTEARNNPALEQEVALLSIPSFVHLNFSNMYKTILYYTICPLPNV